MAHQLALLPISFPAALLEIGLVLLLLVPSMPVPALAQGAPDLNIIDKRIKEEQKRPRERKPPPRLDTPPSGVPVSPAAIRPFVLNGVIIEGMSVFKPSDVTGTYEDYVLKEVSDAEVDAILVALTQRYHAAGYFLSRAIAPKQVISNGILRIRVVEGYIGRFMPAGNYDEPALLERYARPVLRERPATLQTVERQLLLMNDLPGLTLEPELKPVNAETGEYELIVKTAYKPVSAFGRLDNRGTPDVGRLQGFVGMGLNGLLGLGESIYGTFATVPDEPRELLYGSVNASVPVGTAGTYASIYGAYGAIDAGGSSARFDTESTSEQVILRTGHPLIRSRAQNLWINGSFDYRNFEQTQFGQTTTNDRLRVFRAGVSYELKDDWKGDSQIGLGVSQGVDIMDASDDGAATNSRSNGKSQFTKLTGNAVRLQGVTDRISLRASVAGQWSANPLLSYEEFSLGGEGYGRGYDYGELSGEHGAAFSGEMRYGSSLNWRWLSEYQLYGFYDIGAVWNETNADSLSFDHLSSAGAGLRLRWSDHFRTGFEAAKPLDRPVATTGDYDWRFFFSAVANY